MVAEYTRRTVPKGRPMSSFAPKGVTSQRAKNGRVSIKLCHHIISPPDGRTVGLHDLSQLLADYGVP